MRYLGHARGLVLVVGLAVLVAGPGGLWAAGLQADGAQAERTQAGTAQPRRIHLYLTDGSYQIVLSYRVVGNVVHYYSAERAGEEEQIPLRLVDLDATRRWEQQHASGADAAAGASQGRMPQIDPELLQEEEDRASLTPEVAPDLRLPEEDSVLVLDAWHGAPELVPLEQSDGELNHSTSHNVLKKALNPLAASHELVMLNGVSAAVQVHVETPVFYLRVGDDSSVSTGEAITVDTHGAGAGSAKKDADATNVAASRYVIVRADVRVDARRIASFNTSFRGSTSEEEDVVPTTSVLLRGGHWLKLTPTQPLIAGEYALMEVLSDHEVNLGVWDFGVHPTAPENRDTIKPQPKRPTGLERRQPE